MGRLVNIPYFSSPAALESQQSDATSLRQLRPDILDEADSLGLQDDDESAKPYKLKQVKIAKRMYKKFEGRVIRRTVNSRGIDNKPLVEIPPAVIKHLIIHLYDHEMKRLKKAAKMTIKT